MTTVEAKLNPVVQLAMDAVLPVLVDVSEVQKFQNTVKFVLGNGQVLKIQVKNQKAE